MHFFIIFVLGYPLPTVAWFFNGNPIDIEDQKKYRLIKPAVLEIKNIMEHNIGSYECEASNIFGKTRSETYLEILGKYLHCVKSVRIRSYSGSHFPTFGLNTDQNNPKYGHFFRIVVYYQKRKVVLKNFPIFTGKHLFWNLFLIKSECLQLY